MKSRRSAANAKETSSQASKTSYCQVKRCVPEASARCKRNQATTEGYSDLTDRLTDIVAFRRNQQRERSQETEAFHLEMPISWLEILLCKRDKSLMEASN